ncbi:MAG: pilus (MSHA type) biogenesis protein MshL [Deltaproteobacteria bacterium]|nr:pilus (MSHA type) biogenesis protein MshL [Deltaproteobacteria bacterium]
MSRFTSYIILILCIFCLFSCAINKRIEKEQFSVKQEMSKVTPIKPKKLPEYKPPLKEVSPFEGKIITLTAKDADFKHVLDAIAKEAGLNLVIDSRLKSETGDVTEDTKENKYIIIPPVTVAFNKTPLKEAIDNISACLDIFYQVSKKTLYIKGVESRIYHLNCIASQKEVNISVGGDVLGSSSFEESATAPLTGEFSIKDKKEPKSSDIYTQIEEAIKSMLSPYGSFSVNRSIGLLEVSDRREPLERIDAYIHRIIRHYASQVLITAKVLEVKLNNECKYGIDWSSIHGNIGSYAFDPITQSLKLASENPVPALEMIISSEKHGFDATINALEQFGDVKVLSNPRIRVTNGQPAVISVGTNKSFIKEIKLTTTATEGGATIIEPEVEISSIFDGIMLGVLPYIDFDKNYVNISITPIKSDLVALEEKEISGDTYTLPTVDLKETSTQIRVKSGDIIVIGGLLSKNINRQRKSIPLFGDIPYLGYLFSQRTDIIETTEMVILLEPVILTE